MTNVNIVVAPRSSEVILNALIPNATTRVTSEHRIYALLSTEGAPRRWEYVVDGVPLIHVECFRSLADAELWIAHDIAQSRLVPQGGVS